MDHIFDPELPIIDPHHHLWDFRKIVDRLPVDLHPFFDNVRRHPLYGFDELAADVGSGHNVIATVYVEAGTAYRKDGPIELRPVGETEHVVGVVAVAAERELDGVCAGIVAHADLMLGDQVLDVLEAHRVAGRGRVRGVRHAASWDADPSVVIPGSRTPPGLLLDDAFRSGYSHLAPLGLTFDALVFEPQMPDVIDLARAFPETTIVLNHVGHPLGFGPYADRVDERFAPWRASMESLAGCPNVVTKIGGFAIGLQRPSYLADPPPTVDQMAAAWRPYIETAIELFGPQRCMFESNFPVDAGGCSYASLWNVFKHVTEGHTPDDRAALFAGTAAIVYRLDAELSMSSHAHTP